MAQHERPLSPFLHYRWQYTNTLSILHRLSGVFMSVGLVLFVYWLAAIASGQSSYDQSLACFSSLLTKISFGLAAGVFLPSPEWPASLRLGFRLRL